jgi:pimeloyl-ACP methyl ester carboxylesterase
MRVAVDDVRLFFDVEGRSLTVEGAAMAARPTVVLLHGEPGADHSLFKPEFSVIADVAQVIYLARRGGGHRVGGESEWVIGRDSVGTAVRM